RDVDVHCCASSADPPSNRWASGHTARHAPGAHKLIPAGRSGAILASPVRWRGSMYESAELVAGRSGIVHGVRGHRPKPRRTRKAPAGAGQATAAAYERKRDLPGLIALWPWEIDTGSVEAQKRLVTMLRRALRRERKRG